MCNNLYKYLKQCDWMKPDAQFAQARQESRRWDGTLTNMQQEVLGSREFWEQDRNIVIHGPTSSGKTLLAEIAALRRILDDSTDNKVLFLVPLRVLVTSQCRQFKSDFRDIMPEGRPLRIWESSADYQDHDAQILNGDYDIAVIVYEKFFSMLNNKSRMLDKCGLIIVDELQMLSSQDRGPKMEFSIMRVLEIQQQKKNEQKEIRIIGLTTSESGVDNLCNWMEATKLGNDIRPVPLMQHFVSCNPTNPGMILKKYVRGSSDALPNEGADAKPERLEVSDGADKDVRKRCLFAVLDRVLSKGDGKGNRGKILVFSNTKRNVKVLAMEIARTFHKLVPDRADSERRKELKEVLDQALGEFTDELDINELSQTIPAGVAFHHSGLPGMVREAIEDDFRDENGRIRIIVCTETLMIGVNLPADVVILHDGSVYRGDSKPKALSLQEYRNFIGRAGRLGYGEKGESYLLTENHTHDFNVYSSDGQTEIVSPFGDEKPEGIAPYFMSWISGGEEPDAKLRIQQGIAQSFCCNPQKNNQQYIAEYSSKILAYLERLKLEDSDGTQLTILRTRKRLFAGDLVLLTELGKALAPYALKLETDAVLIDYVIHHRESLCAEVLQFRKPVRDGKDVKDGEAVKDEWIPSRALLELLYTICQCEEVVRNPVLQILLKNDDRQTLNEQVKTYLRTIYPERPGDWTTDWCRPLSQLAHSRSVMEEDELRASTRAVILALWMAGCSVRTIRELTRLNIQFSTSDIERLSELVAYIMEALSKCQGALGMEAKDRDGMYILSTSMKYGVPRSLVILANTHARGITRPFLLRIGDLANRAGKTPLEYVLASTDERYGVLCKALKEREQVQSYVQQVENKSLEIPGRFRNLIPLLLGLDAGTRPDLGLVTQNLTQFFEHLARNTAETDCGIQVFGLVGDNGIQVQFPSNGRSDQIAIQVLRPEIDNNNEWTNRIAEFGIKCRNIRERTGIAIQAVTVLCGAPPEGEARLPSGQLVISSEMLGIVLLACMLKVSENTNTLIYRVLSDLKGAFILNGGGYFNTYGQIWELVDGYCLERTECVPRKPHLFFYPGIFNYHHSIQVEESAKVAVLPWGKLETPASEINLASFYHRAMRYSRQAERNLSNSRVIFCSRVDQQDVDRFSDAIICVNDPDKGMDDLLKQLMKKLCSNPRRYEYDVGISFRGVYLLQMEQLKQELELRHKKVLFMSTEDFTARMAGNDLDARLTELFSQCRHIIACDTEEYDRSIHTFVEYNVIKDKLEEALKDGQGIPIHLVRFDGVPASERLSVHFRHFHQSYYNEGEASRLADELIRKMDNVDQGRA